MAIGWTKLSEEQPRMVRMLKELDWKHPTGPESTIVGKEHHPLFTYDALAYAKWVDKKTPNRS